MAKPTILNPSSESDADLMQRLASGDVAALGELVVRHQHRALELASRFLGDRTAAEDIAQDAFMRVWRNAGKYKPTAKFSTWLYRIVVNLCLDARKKKTPVSSENQPLVLDSAPDPSQHLEVSETVSAVQLAVAQLPERQRVVLIMHRFSGLSTKEVAEATEWTVSAVESLLVRAYRTLRKTLEDDMQN